MIYYDQCFSMQAVFAGTVNCKDRFSKMTTTTLAAPLTNDQLLIMFNSRSFDEQRQIRRHLLLILFSQGDAPQRANRIWLDLSFNT